MSVGSSTGGGTTGTRSPRARFREWRHRRPFAGGVLLCLAGLLIAWVPLQFAFELLLVGGSYTYVGMLWAVGVFLCGAFALYRPDLSTVFGVLGVALSILSLLGALGGLLVGMLVGIVGGNLCVAWQRPEAGGEGRGGGPGTGRRPVRSDGGSRSDGAGSGGPRRGAPLGRLRRSGRRAVPDTEWSPLRATSPATPGGLLDAATAGGATQRLAVTVAVLVTATGTLTLVTAAPAAAILGDQEETTYTVDVGEIRLGEDGRICAASVGSDTYRVTITDARLVDTTVYQQRGGEAVRTHFPTLQVEDAMVMYTRDGGEGLDLLATTVGCTDEDQTSRTVFRNRYQTGERLRAPGVSMLNLEATDATVPEPGGFRFAAPADDGPSPVPNGSGGTGVVDGIDAVEGTAGNATGGPGPAGAVGNATSGASNATGDVVSSAGETVDDTTGEVTGVEPPENASRVVDDATDAVDDTTGEVTGTAGDATNATDEAVDGTVDDATDAVEGTNATDEAVDGTVDDATDAVDGTTATVEGTTDEGTDGVDGPAGSTDGGETSTPTDDGESATPTDDGEASTGTATPDGTARPGWLDQVDDRATVLETIAETEGGVDDVSNVTSDTVPLSDEAIAAAENLTRLDDGTVLLLNGTDPADVSWAGDHADDPDASSVGTETVTTETSVDDGESEAESDDGSTLAGTAG